MTALEVYWLVVPFVLMGLGWLAVWWNHREAERSRREIRALQGNAGE